MEQCNLCSEDRDSDDLIEVKGSFVKLKTGIVEFLHAMLNVFCENKLDNIKQICRECKDQIVTFYNFKEKVKENLPAKNVSRNQELLQHVEDFLCGKSEEMKMIKSETTLTITPVNDAKQ
ncbi:CLUMA_CG008365, isoform A [Clunio marinus]|uniref:CLUMA_CG008365, isoform A n=1 Tax=Clunio marinus TaxID=568069 RepID=A0A1J1I8X5_9DIPT|nr:CLUMA_CG008365, isoform A [Clunio marinus]